MIFLLLVLFQVKHFVADYPLQGKYMLKKFSPNWDFFIPLFLHSAVHAAFTLLIAAYFKPEIAFEVALLDLVVHFTMDRIKAGPKYLGRYKDMYDKKFWWSLGLDQSVHHLTHYFIIYLLVG
jgi:hypothetical protein